MLISQLIKKLEKIKAKEGDLETFTANGFLIERLEVETDNSNYPEDWNMPEKFLLVGDTN